MKNKNLIIAIIILAVGVIIFYFSYSLRVSPSAKFDCLACASNGDCATTYYPLNNCCMDCDTFIINKEGLENQKDWRKNNCPQEKESHCQTFKCRWPDIKVKCINNKCAKE